MGHEWSAKGRAVAILMIATLLLAGTGIVPAHAATGAYTAQYLESPAYVFNDHTGFGTRWATLTGSGLPDGQYYVRLLVTDTEDPSLATVVRGFTWNPASKRWVQNAEADANFPTVTAASSGTIGNQWSYGKVGDKRISGAYYISVQLTSVADGTVYYPALTATLGSARKAIQVLDPRTDGIWVHNGTDRSEVYSDTDVSGKRVAILGSAASTTGGDTNFPPTAPGAPLYSLWECQKNVIDDDMNGVVDDEAYGPMTRSIGDYRISVQLDEIVDIYVNRNQTSKGGFLINDYNTGTTPDVDVALGAADTDPPTKVADLAATTGAGSIGLEWTASTDDVALGGYQLFRWTEGATSLPYTVAPSLVATLTADATSYVDQSVAYGQQYSYELRPFDTATNFGQRSNTATISAATPPFITVYRFYNNRTGTHFYTAGEQEKNTVLAKWPTIFTLEGPAFMIDPWVNATPLYRFYNNRTGAHFYTASEDEKSKVLATWPTIFSFEGVAYNVTLDAGAGIPVYRFYNNRTATHFYTVSADERDHVLATWPTIFTYEGVAYYIGAAK